MGQIWAGAFDRQGFNGWLKVQRDETGKGSTGGKGLDAWSIRFLKIWNTKIMCSGSANVCLPWLDKCVPKPIPTYCQSINIVSKL